MKSNLSSLRYTREISIHRDVRHPGRLAAGPNPSRQTLAACKHTQPGVQGKRIGMYGWRLPLIKTAHHPCRLIYPPEYAQVPFQALPDCLDDFWNSLF